MIRWLHFVLLVLGVCFTPRTLAFEEGAETVIINTPSGRIKGLKTVSMGTHKTVYQFRKIPFAKPPVNELRFSNPEPYGSWNDVLDGTEFGPSCIQDTRMFMNFIDLPNKELSEDCLFLNIYVPGRLSKDNKLPVMVWIHGGGYILGQGMAYKAGTLSTFGDVIVVNINYRLSVFGFMSLRNEKALGNYGIWDQKLALEWIHNNIESFGGDSSAVTIFGESAGGFSVSLQALIPSNKGLFQRVIAQSGNSHSRFAFSDQFPAVSKTIGESVGCQLVSDSDIDNFLKCMREVPAEDLISASDLFKLRNPTDVDQAMVFGPVLDGVLIPDDFSKLMSLSDPETRDFFHSLDYMVGTTSDEGSIVYMFATTPPVQEKYKFNVSEGIPRGFLCDAIVPALTKIMHMGENSDVTQALCDHYTDDTSPDKQSMRALDLWGDSLFVIPSVEAANSHSINNKNKNTYFYRFSRPSPVPLMPPPKWFNGSAHGDECYFPFAEDMMTIYYQPLKISHSDLVMSNTILRYWTNFAKSGDPNNPVSGDDLVEWPQYDTDSQGYMDLNLQSTARYRPSFEAVKLFLEDIPKILQKDKNREEL